MNSWPKLSIAATIFCALIGAAQADRGGNGNHYGWDKGGGGSKGAPGPIAGAGLPVLLIAGGYALVRRYRSRSKASQ